jgi:hypothetical protein
MLSQFCDASAEKCYVDECVPKGSCRYGFAKPYECCTACVGTSYFEAAEVTTEPGASCALGIGKMMALRRSPAACTGKTSS